mmetsp:Transcript_15169/g.33918  ORF Transcript_15169/g.33918 Transcript_15169/m.33918 type:complete len:163 (-) Transcript_15169:113-601(-)
MSEFPTIATWFTWPGPAAGDALNSLSRRLLMRLDPATMTDGRPNEYSLKRDDFPRLFDRSRKKSSNPPNMDRGGAREGLAEVCNAGRAELAAPIGKSKESAPTWVGRGSRIKNVAALADYGGRGQKRQSDAKYLSGNARERQGDSSRQQRADYFCGLVAAVK